jgi:hypothetical protein
MCRYGLIVSHDEWLVVVVIGRVPLEQFAASSSFGDV